MARTRGAAGALHSARGTASENTNPNVVNSANGRFSPRLGSRTSNSQQYAFGSTRGGLGVAAQDPPRVLPKTTHDDREMKKQLDDFVSNEARRVQKGTFGKDITNIADSQSSKDGPKPLKPLQASLQPLPAVSEPAPLEVAQAEVGNATNIQVIADGMSALSLTQADEVDTPETQNVAEYAPEIMNLWFLKESAAARPDYMESQTDITGKMRTILIDWMVEVHMKYKLRPETLHLTVNLVDRYLTKVQSTRKCLQLVGVCAMFIAAKFEEINPPELHDWVYITDNAYKKEDLLNMECSMLATLGFQITVPTAAHFFEVLQKANGCNVVHRELAQYLLELSLLELRMLQYTPSQLVSAALMLSNKYLKRSTLWPSAMVNASRHGEQSLQRCVDDFRRLLEADRVGAGSGAQLQAVNKKFSLPQRHAVAKMKLPKV